MHRFTSPAAARATTARPSSGAVAIIPARLQSTRLPEKALQDLGGAPLIVRVLARVRAATAVEDVVVATDSDRIAAAVRAAGGKAILTRSDHPSGLDRVAEAERLLAGETAADDGAVVLNVQGDEPYVNPEGLDRLVRLFDRTDVAMATLAAPFRAGEDPDDPNRVKVVVDRAGRALYFSRSRVPHGADPDHPALLHVGVYAYRRATLRALAALPPCPLERAERLEQLRALWNGIAIHVAVGDFHSIGIDTPADLERARAQWGERRDP
ncbi:MAG: 3-deoxy-manno-octulosonate cytidylyltransferase [Hyphomicrobiales bacterium]